MHPVTEIHSPQETGDEGDEPSSGPILPDEIPPELAQLSKDEVRDLLVTMTGVALRLTKARPVADALVSDVWNKLCTTRRWQPDRGPLLRHALGALKSELHHQRASKKDEKDRRAGDGFHREVRGERERSAEQMQLEEAEADGKQKAAATQLERLAESVKDHPPAPDVLACKARGIDKPADIARALGVPVQKVYQSLDLLKRHLRRLQQDEGPRGDGDET
jgi:DNA-directed RNA polymerase specialized sigma24 family protein